MYCVTLYPLKIAYFYKSMKNKYVFFDQTSHSEQTASGSFFASHLYFVILKSVNYFR